MSTESEPKPTFSVIASLTETEVDPRSALSLGSDVRQGGAGQPSAIETQSFIHPELKTLAVGTETPI